MPAKDCETAIVEVFHHKGSEHDSGVRLVLQAEVIVGFQHDHRGGHRQQTAEENAFHKAPGQGLGRDKSDQEHSDELHGRSDDGASADLQQLLETELQAEAEHQEYYADLRPLVDGRLAGYSRKEADVRADQETGEDVADD